MGRGSNTGDPSRVRSVWIQNHLLSKVPDLDAEVFVPSDSFCATAQDPVTQRHLLVLVELAANEGLILSQCPQVNSTWAGSH